MLMKIISGGQSGVDRGALELGFPCGGWVPSRTSCGRWADRGSLSINGTKSKEYRQRTRTNIKESSGTAVLYFRTLEGGTERTVRICENLQKPYLLIDADKVEAKEAARLIANFISAHSIEVLNIAGPRASKAPAAHAYAKKAVKGVLKSTIVTPGKLRARSD